MTAYEIIQTAPARILEAIEDIGGTEPTIRELPEVVLANVRFCNCIGFWETRYGASLTDLANRVERYRDRMNREAARAIR